MLYMTETRKYRDQQFLRAVKSVAEYLDVINRQLDGSPNCLFRGHRCEEWALVPSVARDNFISRSDESKMLEEFTRRALPHTASIPALSRTDWLAIAQHHGMPTRLLDWTGSALMALWFAVEKSAEATSSAAVWVLPYTVDDFLDDDEKAPFGLHKTVLVKPRHVTSRITAQDGWFTLHKSGRSDASGSLFISLDNNLGYRERLRYVTVPAESFGQIRFELATAGITAAVIYPDLGGIAQYVTWAHKYSQDELDYRLGTRDPL